MKSKPGEHRLYLSKEAMSSLPDEPGIYFLYQEKGILVYIGKAASLRKRIVQHDGQKEFSRIGYELVHYSRARKREKELLGWYVDENGQLPHYNKQS